MTTTFIEWAGSLILLGGLVHLSFIDWTHYRLPNYWTKPLIILGLLYNFNVSLDAYPYVLGAVLGYVIFWTVETAYRLFRKTEGLGRGDAKLLAAGGAWCGALALPFIILLASSAALIFVLFGVRDKSGKTSANFKLPFGPFLALGIAITFLTLKFL
jgi:leader peptidase (prepilin peptidase)/N-methyltransferase